MKLFAASLIVAASLTPLAAAQNVKVAIDGIGAMKCTSILSGLKEEPTKAVNAIVGWSFGYITRRNVERAVAGQNQVEFREKVTPERVLNVVSGFCEKNSDARLFEIIDALYTILLEDSAIVS